MPIVIRSPWGKLSLFLFSHKAQAKRGWESTLLVHAGKLTLKTLVLTYCSQGSCLKLLLQLHLSKSWAPVLAGGSLYIHGSGHLSTSLLKIVNITTRLTCSVFKNFPIFQVLKFLLSFSEAWIFTQNNNVSFCLHFYMLSSGRLFTFQVNATFFIQEFSYKTFILHIGPSTPVRKKSIMDVMSDWLNKLYLFPSLIHFLKLLFHRSFIINLWSSYFIISFRWTWLSHIDSYTTHGDSTSELSLCPTQTYQASFFTVRVLLHPFIAKGFPKDLILIHILFKLFCSFSHSTASSTACSTK